MVRVDKTERNARYMHSAHRGQGTGREMTLPTQGDEVISIFEHPPTHTRCDAIFNKQFPPSTRESANLPSRARRVTRELFRVAMKSGARPRVAQHVEVIFVVKSSHKNKMDERTNVVTLTEWVNAVALLCRVACPWY